MKRIILFLLRVVLLLLIILFGYQKTTGKQLDGAGVRRVIDIGVINARTNLKRIFGGTTAGSGTTVKKTNPTSGNSAVASPMKPNTNIASVKKDIERNRDFLSNLIKDISKTSTSIGKDNVYVTRIPSSDATNDMISVEISGEVKNYPAKYNTDNQFSINNGFLDNIYRANGIQLLSADQKFVYYPAYDNQGSLKGTILNLNLGTSLMTDNLAPLLFYQNRYLFTIRNLKGDEGLFSLTDGELKTLGGWHIDNIAIDADVFAFFDGYANQLHFFSLSNLQLIKTINFKKVGVSFLGFVQQGDYYRIAYNDNLKRELVYEKWKK